jgi:hypothetical protein
MYLEHRTIKGSTMTAKHLYELSTERSYLYDEHEQPKLGPQNSEHFSYFGCRMSHMQHVTSTLLSMLMIPW